MAETEKEARPENSWTIANRKSAARLREIIEVPMMRRDAVRLCRLIRYGNMGKHSGPSAERLLKSIEGTMAAPELERCNACGLDKPLDTMFMSEEDGWFCTPCVEDMNQEPKP